jgi:predicted GIY-YIG superfamily endonuclease
MFHYVYLLEDIFEKSWYIGYTADLNQRVKDYNNGNGGKTTKQKKSWRLFILKVIERRRML